MAKSGKNDKMVKDIRASLKNAAKVGGKYIKGTAKLFLASGKDMLNTEMPVLAPMIEVNADLLKDTAKFLRNPVDSINKQVNRALQTETFQSLQSAAKNLVADLKSGVLYDKNRMRDSWGEGVDDLLNGFGDFDMSGFDENGDFTASDDDDDFDDFDKFLDLAGAQEDSANARTEATINAIGTSADAIIQTENANSQENIRLSIKQHSQTMSGIQNMITVQSATLQGMADSAKATFDLTRETHQQIMDSMAGITGLLEKIVENTTAVTPEQMTPNDFSTVYGSNGALDIKKYLKQVVRNVDNYFGASTAISMMTGGQSLKDLIDLYADNPLQIVTDMLVRQIVPMDTVKAMNRTNENIASFFPALFQKLAERGVKGSGVDGSTKDVIAGFFGINNKSSNYVRTDAKNLGERASITNKTLTAIETVIPMWLSKIYSGISGEELKVYNYSTGKLETAASIIAGSSHSANDLANRMGTGARDIMSRGRGYKFLDEDMDEDFQNYIYRYLQFNAEGNKFINPFESAKEFKEKMPSMSKAGSNNEELYHNLLLGILKNLPQSDLMSLGRETYKAHESRESATARLNNEMRENGQIAALMGWVDDRVVSKLSEASNEKKYGLNDTDIQSILKADRDAILKRGGTQATNVWLSDITRMLRRGIVTYTYIIGGTKTVKPATGDDADTANRKATLNAIIKTVTDDAGAESARLTEVLREIEKAETDKATEKANNNKRRKEDSEKVDPAKPFTEAQRYIPKDNAGGIITASIAEDIQRSYVIENTEEGESNNPWVEYARQEQKTNAVGQKTTDKVIKSVQDEVDALGERMGLKGFFKLSKDVAKAPFNIFTVGLNVLDSMMFKALYGEDAVYQVDTNSVPALITSLQTYMKSTLTSMKDWFTGSIIDPIKEKVLGPEGFLNKAADSIRENIVDPLKEKVDTKVKGVTNKVFGEYDKDTKTFTGGKLSEKLNKIGGKVRGIVNPAPKFYQDENGTWYDPTGNIVDASVVVSAMTEYENNKKKNGSILDRLLYGKYATENRKGVRETLASDTIHNTDGSVSIAGRTEREYSGIGGFFKHTMDFVSDLMFGSYNEVTTINPDGTIENGNGKDIEKSKYFNKLKSEISDGLPDMAIGAGLGVIGSLFLPGGPILGAILGSGIGLARSSETLKTYLFGDLSREVVKTDKFGNPILDKDGNTVIEKTRSGGIISDKVYDGVKQFAPKMGKGALIGAVAGGLGLIPFGMGPAIGALFGAMGGMISASKEFQKALWGDPADDSEEGRKKGLISKDFREKAKKALKDHLPAGITGAAIGTALGMGVGLIPGLSLLPTGPIFGILGAMTGLSQADAFNKFLFGDEVEALEEVKDKDGKVVGTKKKKVRQGGIFNKMFDGVKEKVVEPLARGFNKVGDAIGEWFKNDIIEPFKDAVEPVKDAIRKAGEAVWGRIKSIGDTIMKGIKDVFEVEPKKFMKEKIWDPLNNFTKKLFSGIGKIIGKILAAPFKAIEFLVSGGKTIGGEPVSDVMDDIVDGRNKRRREKLGTRIGKIWKRSGKDVSKQASNADKQVTKFTERMGSITFRDKKYTKDANGRWVDEDGNAANALTSFRLNIKDRKARDSQPSTDTPKTDKPYYQDANGRWHDSSTGKFAKREDAEKAMGITPSTPKKDDKKAPEPQKPNAPAPDKAKDKKDDKTDKDQKAKGETTSASKPGSKTNNEYLKTISKNTGKIYDEIKGQLGGTGWELKYIRTLLSKQYGPLADSELPEEMEGSTKNVKKRRTIFGKAKDKVVDFFGGVKDKIGGAISKVFSVITKPLSLIGTLLSKGAKAIKAGISGIVEGLKFTGKILGEVALGIAGAVRDVVASVGKIVLGAARGIGEALGNTVGLISGLVKDVGLSVGALTRSVIETVGALAPEVIYDVFKGTKWLVKGALKVGGKIIKGGAKGVKSAFKFIRNKLFRRKKKGAEGGSTSSGSGDEPIPAPVDGGYLDYINEPISIALTNGAAFPVVAVANGMIVGPAPLNAIPVFIMGIHRPLNNNPTPNNQLPGSTSPSRAPVDAIDVDYVDVDENGETAEKPEAKESTDGSLKAKLANKLRKFKQKYFNVDSNAEKSDNAKDVYDKAVANAQSEDDINAIVTVSNLNANSAVINESSDKKDDNGGLLSALLGGKGQAILNGLKTIFPGLAVLLGGKLGKDKAAAAAAAGGTTGSAVSILGSTLGAAVLPAVGTVNALANDEYGHAASYAARGLTRVGSKFLSTTGVTEMASAGARVASKGAGSKLLQKGAVKVAGGIEKAGGALSSKLTELVRKFFSNKTVIKVLEKFPDAGLKMTKGFTDQISKVALRLGATTATELLKKINFVVVIAQAVIDLTTGMANAAQHFKIDPSDVTIGHRLAAGFAKALSGLAFGLIPVSWFSEFIYKIFANKEAEEELKEQQAEMQNKVAAINMQNGTSLTVEEYQQYYKKDGSLKKSGLFHLRKVYDPVSGKWVKKKDADQYGLNTDGIESPESARELRKAKRLEKRDARKEDREEKRAARAADGKSNIFQTVGNAIGSFATGVKDFVVPLVKSAHDINVLSRKGDLEGLYKYAPMKYASEDHPLSKLIHTLNFIYKMIAFPATAVSWIGHKVLDLLKPVVEAIKNVGGDLKANLVQRINTGFIKGDIKGLWKNDSKVSEDNPIGKITTVIDYIGRVLITPLSLVSFAGHKIFEVIKSLGVKVIETGKSIGTNFANDFRTGVIQGDLSGMWNLTISANDGVFGDFARGIGVISKVVLTPISLVSMAGHKIFSFIGDKIVQPIKSGISKTVTNLEKLEGYAGAGDVKGLWSVESNTDDGTGMNLWLNTTFKIAQAVLTIPAMFNLIIGKISPIIDKVKQIWNTLWNGADDSDTSTPGHSSGGFGRGRVTALNQTSSRYNINNDDMKLNGCGPTAAAMVSTAYGKKGDPLAANKMSYGMGMRASDGGTDPNFFGKYAKSQGFGMSKGPSSPDMVQSSLSKGDPVVLMGKGGAFGSGMHYLVADGIDGRGNVSIKDPLGGIKHAKLDGLLSNTKDTIYSYGRGKIMQASVNTDDMDAANAEKNKTAQQTLVNWMKSKAGSLSYSLDWDKQNPDNGSASCASTVGWAYRKALGGDFESNPLSASSTMQSQDSRFQTIYSKGLSKFDMSKFQPGDIVYVATGSDPNSISHTEMYIGDGQDLSHGGPDLGPSYKTINDWRKERIIKVRRYNGFLNGDTVTYNDAEPKSLNLLDGLTPSGTTTGSHMSGSFGAESGKLTLSDISSGITSSIDEAFSGIIGRFSDILNGILGGDSSTPTDNPVNDELESKTKSNKLKGDTNGAKIFNFLRKKGLTKEQAAGIMGNIQAESELRPEAVQGDYLKGNRDEFDKQYYTDVNNGTITRDGFINEGPGGGGYGLAQWTDAIRKANLYDMSKNSKKGIEDLSLQLDYLWSELNGGYKSSVLKPIKNTTSIEDAAKIFLQKFEIPQGWDTQEKVDERANYAKQMYSLYAEEDGSTGRGAGSNVRAMNNKIEQINRLIDTTRQEASTESVISEVTNRITDAVGKGDGTADDNMLKVIAETLAVMVEHLAAIRDNTAKPQRGVNVSNRSIVDNSVNNPAYPSGDNDADNIGKPIIDRLTTK